MSRISQPALAGYRSSAFSASNGAQDIATLESIKSLNYYNTCWGGPHGDGGGDHARAMASFLTGRHPHKTGGTDLRAGVSVDQLIASKVGGAWGPSAAAVGRACYSHGAWTRDNGGSDSPGTAWGGWHGQGGQ
jgi:uncharacterized protein DUF1552